MQPWADGPRQLGARVVARHFVAVTGSPHDVGIGEVGKSEAGLAAAQVVLPLADARAPAPPEPTATAAATAPAEAALSRNIGSAFLRGAEAAHGAIVLHVAVDMVGHILVHGHVIHLADGQRDAGCGAAVVGGHVHAAIVGYADAVGILGVDENVVGVAAPWDGAERLAAIGGLPEAAVGHQHFVGVGGRDGQVNVVAGAAGERALPVHHGPVCAAVIGAPDRTLVGGLNQRIGALGIAGRNGHVDLAERRFGHPVALYLLPGVAAVVSDVDAAAGSAAQHRVGVHHHVPGAGEQDVGVLGVHGEAGAAGVGVDEQHAVPGLAAILGAEYAALLLRPGEAAGGAGVGNVGIGGMGEDPADAPGLDKAHIGPGLPGIGG